MSKESNKPIDPKTVDGANDFSPAQQQASTNLIPHLESSGHQIQMGAGELLKVYKYEAPLAKIINEEEHSEINSEMVGRPVK